MNFLWEWAGPSFSLGGLFSQRVIGIRKEFLPYRSRLHSEDRLVRWCECGSERYPLLRAAQDTLSVVCSRPPSHWELKKTAYTTVTNRYNMAKKVAHTAPLHCDNQAKIERPEHALEPTRPALTAQALGVTAQALGGRAQAQEQPS